MAIRDTGTEQLIKDTAKHIFFKEGRLHATTQDIADAAGVNRTLVNYYYRSRDILFEQVFKEASQEMRIALDLILEADLPFKSKIEKFIEEFLIQAMKYPYRELYIVNEINRYPSDEELDKKNHSMKKFIKEIKNEMELGHIKTLDPRHFIMNLFALMAYPLIAASLNKKYFNITDDEHAELMKERKQIIFELIYP